MLPWLRSQQIPMASLHLDRCDDGIEFSSKVYLALLSPATNESTLRPRRSRRGPCTGNND